MQPFDVCLAFTLGAEGGVSNHLNDKGGLTNSGVTQSTYDAYRDLINKPRQSVTLIKVDELRKLYRHMFWNVVKGDDIAREKAVRVALAVFDAAVHHGPGRALKWYSLASSTDNAMESILTQREAFMRQIALNDPSQKVFLQGWLNRLDNLRKYVKDNKL